MKIGCVLAAALVSLPMSESRAGCYGREDGRPQTRFMLRGSEALDTKTGLIWQRCSLGMTWDGPRGCVGERMVVGLDEAMRKAEEGGAKWRVPSGPELESIIDRSCGSPVVDVGVFPDIRKDEDGEADYWTTNPAGMANLYYFFDFMSGRADGHTRGFQMSVRLVRSKPTSDWKRTGNARFGSKADMGLPLIDVRFTPESGHREALSACPPRAISGLMHRSKKDRYSITSLAVVSNECG